MASSSSSEIKPSFKSLSSVSNNEMGIIVSVMQFNAKLFNEGVSDDEYDKTMIELLTRNEYDFMTVQNLKRYNSIQTIMEEKGYSCLFVFDKLTTKDSTIISDDDTGFAIFYRHDKFQLKETKDDFPHHVLIYNKPIGIVGFFRHIITQKQIYVASIAINDTPNKLLEINLLFNAFDTYHLDDNVSIIVGTLFDMYDSRHIDYFKYKYFDDAYSHDDDDNDEDDAWEDYESNGMIWFSRNRNVFVDSLLYDIMTDDNEHFLYVPIGAKLEIPVSQ